MKAHDKEENLSDSGKVAERHSPDQSVEVPSEFELTGPDCSRVADRIFPEDLRGASVLDVTCGRGFFCFEAKKRNAGRVVGLQSDNRRLAAAVEMNERLGHDVELRQLNFMEVDESELGRFDYVVCLDVFPYASEPMYMLRRLVSLTKNRLVLEVANLDEKQARGAPRRWWRVLRWVPSRYRPGLMVTSRKGQFLFTRKAIHAIFRSNHPEIESVEFFKSDRKGRYVASAQLRELELLGLISGPSSCGKSELIRRMRSADTETLELFDASSLKEFKVINAIQIRTRLKPGIANLFMHYDIRRPTRTYWGFDSYREDPALRLMRVAKRTKVYVLICSPEALLERIRGERPGRRSHERLQKHAKQKQERISEYLEPGRLRWFYEQWISYCKAWQTELKYIDVTTRSPRIIGEEEALRLVGAHGT